VIFSSCFNHWNSGIGLQHRKPLQPLILTPQLSWLYTQVNWSCGEATSQWDSRSIVKLC